MADAKPTKGGKKGKKVGGRLHSTVESVDSRTREDPIVVLPALDFCQNCKVGKYRTRTEQARSFRKDVVERDVRKVIMLRFY